jgi:hypothetical protein
MQNVRGTPNMFPAKRFFSATVQLLGVLERIEWQRLPKHLAAGEFTGRFDVLHSSGERFSKREPYKT